MDIVPSRPPPATQDNRAMPALYRMPAFYLAAALLGSAVGLGGFVRGGGARPAPAPVETATDRPEAAPAREQEAETARPAADGILRTPEGLRRKVVVKDLGLTCREEPGDGPPAGPPLDYFAIRYVYTERPGWFQVGPAGDRPDGWVPAGSVLEWDTRLMARPTRDGGRPALVIYREESCLLDALAGRRCPKHAGRCPTEGEEAAGKAGDRPAAALGMPILRSKTIPEPDGPPRTIFEVASLVRDKAPPLPPPEPTPDLRPGLRQVYVAVVIDATSSMTATIDAARRAAGALVVDAGKRAEVTLHLALVAYRDVDPIYGYSARLVTDFTDPAGFRAALDQVEAATQADGSVDEAVLDGVATALPAPPGTPAGELHPDWPTRRAGELATKMLVLIGDAPDHARDLKRARELAARANRAGITIAAVSINRPGSLSRDEAARYKAQWHALAAGSHLPRSLAGGAGHGEPVELTLGQAKQLADRLRDLIADRVGHARELAALARAEAEDRLKDYVDARGLTLDAVAPVLVDLHRGEPLPAPRPDPRRGDRKAPSVRRGWIAERSGGKPLVTVEILMTRAELDGLIGELTQLQQATRGAGRDLADLLQVGTAAAAGESSFLAADRGTRTFADHLLRRAGLPPARPYSLLRRSQADLLRADDLDRAALDARLRAAIARLVRRRGEPDWDDPRRTVDGMAMVPYEAVDF